MISARWGGATAILVLAAALAAACASPERPRWSEESRPASARDSGTPVEPGEDGRFELPEEPTLEDYLVYAALHNPGLRAAFETWRGKVERALQVESLPDPRFSYTYYIEEVETRVGPQEQRVGLSQTFPWFGKLSLRGDVAAEEANAAKEEFEAKKLGLEHRVKDLYWDLYALGQTIRITGENIELLRQLEQVAQAKYRVGAPNHPDLIRLQVELGKLENRLRSLEDRARPLRARFDAELGRPDGSPVPWPTGIEKAYPSLEREDLVAALRDRNPELRGLEFASRREETALRLAGRQYYPDFTVGVDWIDTGNADAPNVPDSGKDPWLLTLSIDLPIWWGKYRAGEREAKARIRTVRETRVDRERALVADLESALFRYRDAARRVTLYEDTLIPKGQESFETITAGYRGDTSEFLDLMDSQRVLLEFELEYERARVDRAQAFAAIERLVGGNLPGGRTGGEAEEERTGP